MGGICLPFFITKHKNLPYVFGFPLYGQCAAPLYQDTGFSLPLVPRNHSSLLMVWELDAGPSLFDPLPHVTVE